MRPAILLRLAMVLVASVAFAPARAFADADPPSDVLLLQDVYYPYHPTVSHALQAQLDDLTARARRAGFPIKVALVASPGDLGAVPQLFGHVTRYARFLEREIEYNRPRPTLAVMPGGYGAAATGPHGAAIVARLPVPRTADGMARGAIVAVERLAAADGHPLDVGRLGSRQAQAHRGGTSMLLVFAPLALLALGFAALAIRRRGQRARPADDAAAPYDWTRDD